MDASLRCELESGESDALILARLDAFGECRALSQRRRVQEVRSELVIGNVSRGFSVKNGHFGDAHVPQSLERFLFPLIVTTSASMRPLTVGLATMVRKGGQAGFEMAGATVCRDSAWALRCQHLSWESR